MVAGLFVEGKLKGLDSPIRILNVYDPYNHRKDLWENVNRVGLLYEPSPILTWDLIIHCLLLKCGCW